MFKFIRKRKLKKRLLYLVSRKDFLEISVKEDMRALDEFDGKGILFTSYFYRNLENSERELADVKEEMNYIHDELRNGGKKNGRH